MTHVENVVGIARRKFLRDEVVTGRDIQGLERAPDITFVAGENIACGDGLVIGDDGRLMLVRERRGARMHEDPLVDRLSRELAVALTPHCIDVKPRDGAYDPIRVIVGVTRIPSALRFAAALERAGADATYSAGSGWSFRDKLVGPLL